MLDIFGAAPRGPPRGLSSFFYSQLSTAKKLHLMRIIFLHRFGVTVKLFKE